MTRTAQLRLINEAFNAIPELSASWGFVHEKLFDMNHAAEKQHRHGHGGGFPLNSAAKLFVVKHLLDGWKEPDKFSVDDILSIRNEVLYAQAWAKKYHAELTAWAEKYGQIFEQVDYAELMKAAA